MNHPDLDMEAVKTRLEALRDELLAQSADSQGARDTVMLDQTSVGRLSRMDALQGQAMAKAEEERRRLTLKRIASALARIERGEYGECIACGDWIHVRRLEGDPTVLKCIECAQKLGDYGCLKAPPWGIMRRHSLSAGATDDHPAP